MLTRRKLLAGASASLISKAKANFNLASTRKINLTCPVALDVTKTFLVDKKGDPCYTSSDNGGDLIILSKSDIELYLSIRALYGFNCIIITGCDPSTPTNANGDAPWTGTPFATPNALYWNYITYIFSRADVYNITILFNPWFVGLNNSSGYHDIFYNSSTTIQQNFGTFIGNLCKPYQNVIIALGGDADPNNTTSYTSLNVCGTAIRAANSTTLITFEASRLFENGTAVPNDGYSTYDACIIAFSSVPTWVNLNWLYQSGSTAGSGAQRTYNQPLLPWPGEYFYEGEHSTTAQFLRQQSYTASFGGGFLGTNYGNSLVYTFATGWQGQLTSVGAIGQQLATRLFRSRAFQKLVPDLTNVVMTIGSSNNSFCARTNDGQTIGVYLPTLQSVTIDMSKITDIGSQAKCWWYDVTTGNASLIGIFPNSGFKIFTSSGNNFNNDSDWVLIIDSNAAALPVPGQSSS